MGKGGDVLYKYPALWEAIPPFPRPSPFPTRCTEQELPSPSDKSENEVQRGEAGDPRAHKSGQSPIRAWIKPPLLLDGPGSDMKPHQALTLFSEVKRESSQNWDWELSLRPKGGTDLTLWLPAHRSGQGQVTGGGGKFITISLAIS